jgi:hypothetical protein
LLVVNDPRFDHDERIEAYRTAANELLDRYLDIDWLPWAHPVGLLPLTELAATRRAADVQRRREAEAAMREMAAERRRAEEEENRRREAENRRREMEDRRREMEAAQRPSGNVGGGPSRPARNAAIKKSSQSTLLDEDIDMTSEAGSVGTTRAPPSELKKEEVKRAWAEVKSGRAPAGWVEVSRVTHLCFLRVLLTFVSVARSLHGLRPGEEAASALLSAARQSPVPQMLPGS